MHTYNVYINGEWHTKKKQSCICFSYHRLSWDAELLLICLETVTCVNFVLFKPESNILKVFQHLIKVLDR